MSNIKFPQGKWQQHPSVQKGGHEKFGPSGTVDLVPLSVLSSIPGNRLGKTDVEALKGDIQQNGLDEPLCLSFDPKINHINLGEGQHRTEALKQLGYTHAPVQGIRSSLDYERDNGTAYPANFNNITDEYGYTPGNMRPSHISPDLQAIKYPMDLDKQAFRMPNVPNSMPQLGVPKSQGITPNQKISNPYIPREMAIRDHPYGKRLAPANRPMTDNEMGAAENKMQQWEAYQKKIASYAHFFKQAANYPTNYSCRGKDCKNPAPKNGLFCPSCYKKKQEGTLEKAGPEKPLRMPAPEMTQQMRRRYDSEQSRKAWQKYKRFFKQANTQEDAEQMMSDMLKHQHWGPWKKNAAQKPEIKDFKRTDEYVEEQPGKLTGRVEKLLECPVEWLITLPGLRQEHKKMEPDMPRVQFFKGAVQDKTWRDSHPAIIEVQWNGDVFIQDGNGRIAGAHAANLKTYPCKIEFFGGGEEKINLELILKKYAKFFPRAVSMSMGVPDNQVHPHVQQAISKLPKIPEGHTRLYRMEATPNPNKKLSDWITESPEYKKQQEASGRWYSPHPENLHFYADNIGGPSQMRYLDVPHQMHEATRVSNLPDSHPAKPYSRDLAGENFLSKDLANTSKLVPHYNYKQMGEFSQPPPIFNKINRQKHIWEKYAHFFSTAAKRIDMGGGENPPEDLNENVDWKRKKLNDFNQDMKAPGRNKRLNHDGVPLLGDMPSDNLPQMPENYNKQKVDNLPRVLTNDEFDKTLTNPDKPNSYRRDPLPFSLNKQQNIWKKYAKFFLNAAGMPLALVSVGPSKCHLCMEQALKKHQGRPKEQLKEHFKTLPQEPHYHEVEHKKVANLEPGKEWKGSTGDFIDEVNKPEKRQLMPFAPEKPSEDIAPAFTDMNNFERGKNTKQLKKPPYFQEQKLLPGQHGDYLSQQLETPRRTVPRVNTKLPIDHYTTELARHENENDHPNYRLNSLNLIFDKYAGFFREAYSVADKPFKDDYYIAYNSLSEEQLSQMYQPRHLKRTPEWEAEHPGQTSARTRKLIYVPLKWLITLPGIHGEDRLLTFDMPCIKRMVKLVMDETWARNHPIIVGVQNGGKCAIDDGSHRTRACILGGRKFYPVVFRFMGGSEDVFSIAKMLKQYASHEEN